MQFRSWLLLAAIPTAATAQVAGPPMRPDDPRAPTEPLGYTSAFAAYRPLSEGARRTWRDANDEVGRIGGHSGAIKDSVQRSKPPGTPAAVDGNKPGGRAP